MSMRRWAPAFIAALTGLSACDRDAPFGPDPSAEASIVLRAFYDYDAQAGFGGADRPATGLRFQVLLPGSSSPVVEAVADTSGAATLEGIPVGTYDLRVDPTFLGDSLVLTEIDSTRVTLTPDGVVSVTVGVSPPVMTIAAARALPEGRRVWIEGLALNRRGQSVDGAIHLLGGGGEALRTVFPSATGGAEGDSLRILGRTVNQGARRYLTDGRSLSLAQAVRPVLPLEVEVGAVADAGSGALDARLVLVRNAQVTDTASVPFVGTRVTVGNGDAEFEALLLSQNGFGATIVPGTPVIAMAGLLVPDPGAAGAWRLIPRGQGDVQFGTPPPPPGG